MYTLYENSEKSDIISPNFHTPLNITTRWI